MTGMLLVVGAAGGQPAKAAPSSDHVRIFQCTTSPPEGFPPLLSKLNVGMFMGKAYGLGDYWGELEWTSWWGIFTYELRDYSGGGEILDDGRFVRVHGRGTIVEYRLNLNLTWVETHRIQVSCDETHQV